MRCRNYGRRAFRRFEGRECDVIHFCFTSTHNTFTHDFWKHVSHLFAQTEIEFDLRKYRACPLSSGVRRVPFVYTPRLTLTIFHLSIAYGFRVSIRNLVQQSCTPAFGPFACSSDTLTHSVSPFQSKNPLLMLFFSQRTQPLAQAQRSTSQAPRP